MGRTEDDKEKLKDAAEKAVFGKEDQFKIDQDEITGKDHGPGSFVSARAADAWKVVVDRWSDRGFVVVAGGSVEDRVCATGLDEHTGSSEETRFQDVEIHSGQTCVIYGRSTAIFIRPRRGKK
ncbi:hypothetical protein BDZ45DRAFT_725254 [Acephala macrosclerotiorum]|nr:hypothetical protein BDZ45DRAFT_725254 [Acephala macrosclerotiorum]